MATYYWTSDIEYMDTTPDNLITGCKIIDPYVNWIFGEAVSEWDNEVFYIQWNNGKRETFDDDEEMESRLKVLVAQGYTTF